MGVLNEKRCKQNDDYLYYDGLNRVPPQFITRKMCETSIKKIKYDLKYVPECFMTQEMCETAMKCNGKLIEFVPESFLTLELCKLAVQQNCCSKYDVPEKYYEECEAITKLCEWCCENCKNDSNRSDDDSLDCY